MDNKKNIQWINYLKAICILGVFYVHCNQYYGFVTSTVNNFIHPFYVNAFFFVSGYLLFRKQLSEPLLNQKKDEYVVGEGKRLCSNVLWKLIIPTILFSIIEYFPSHVLRGLGFDIGTFMYKTIGGCTYWFTASLVVAELLIVVLLLTRIKSIWFYFISCCLLFALGQIIVYNGWSFFNQYPSLPWQYKHGLYAIIFVALGGLYCKYESFVNRFMNFYTLIGMIVLYVLCLEMLPKNFKVLVSMLNVNVPGTVLSLLSTLILIELCKKIPFSSLLNYVGQNTIGFYFMSGALPIVLSMVIHKFMPESNALGLMAVFAGSFGIGLGIVYLLNRFTPWVFDFRLLWYRNK